jgi:ABC-2 type transport system permease protein
MILKFLIEKEFKQLLRNPVLPRLILLFPCMMMLLMPWAANLEIKDNNLCVVDNDHSPSSRRLIEKVSGSDYFNLKQNASSYEEAMLYIEKGEADIILEIPRHFEKNMVKENKVNVMISANTVNGTKGGLGSSYLASIVSDFSNTSEAKPAIQMSVLNLFNPHLNYKVFMIPALMVMLLTMLCGFLPSLNIVGEKEVGTIEQINVTPVGKFSFILAKIIPYWIIGLIVLSICFFLAKVLYGVAPAGNLGTIYFFACLFILVISGFGLIISNHSATMQQAMFVMFFFMIIFILMSGLFTPINSMPHWAQWITVFNPLTYFIQVMRMVYLKGSGIGELGTQFIALCSFMLFFNTWAVLSYRKTNS